MRGILGVDMGANVTDKISFYQGSSRRKVNLFTIEMTYSENKLC